MKILILSPHLAESEIATLKLAGITVFSAKDLDSAWQVLQFQGKAMDLAFVHREGVDGEAFIKRVKADPVQADLPIVLISEAWNEADFAKHQSTAQGVNAYLKHPASVDQLGELIQQITGETLSFSVPDAVEEGFASSGFSMQIEEIPIASGDGEEFELSSVPQFEPSFEANLPPAVEIDQEASEVLPYVFQKSSAHQQGARKEADYFAQPLGDAIVPGGAANSPDIETLKQYLLLREQDVAALSSQLKAARDQAIAIEVQLKEERAYSTELAHRTNEQQQRINDFDRERSVAEEAYQAELNELRFQSKAKTDKVKLLDRHVKDAQDEIEKIKERVRQDIRKIRVREKELENKIEIMRRDSEALLVSRENKIIELKRKMDLLEFNMDLLQDQYAREKEQSSLLRERLSRVAQAVRVAGGIIDDQGNPIVPGANASEDQTGGRLKSA